MSGGHHGENTFIIPDYKIYKVDENTPELLMLQKRLAQKGLKDPWIRNQVWKFDQREWGSLSYRKKKYLLRGFKYGFAAFLATIAAETLYGQMYPPPENDHGHH